MATSSPLRQTLMTNYCSPKSKANTDEVCDTSDINTMGKPKKRGRPKKKATPSVKPITTYFNKKDMPEEQEAPKEVPKRFPKKYSVELYQQYGLRIKTMDEIRKERKELEIYTENLQKLKELMCNDKFDDPVLEATIEPKPVLHEREKLNCKNLTDEKLTEYFKKYSKECRNIIAGKHSTGRFEKFFENNGFNTIGFESLSYNISMITFTKHQIHKLAGSCLEEFNDDIEKLTKNVEKFLFEVVLPELCLYIFSDVHNYSLEEATKYLSYNSNGCD